MPRHALPHHHRTQTRRRQTRAHRFERPDLAEWTDATWNPVRGCTKVSPGCARCYAETFAERWRGIPGHPYEHGFDLRVVEDKLTEPLVWARSHKIFVNSMSDLFQERVPKDFVSRVFGVMELADWHIYQVLTKRASRMREVISSRLSYVAKLDHVWLGVSVENRKHGLPRIDELRRTPAALRFLSIEPLLEELNLAGIDWVIGHRGWRERTRCPMRREWVICHLDP